MEVFTSIKDLRQFIHKQRNQGKSVGLIPTMGALHPGHISLLNKALQETDITVCSVFVNPTQFNNPEDLAKYPRTLDSDCSMLEKAGCHAVFAPAVSEMYPSLPIMKFDFGSLERVMEGASRPGHFNGVGIVVSKLFNIVQPDKAYFGQKDIQQVSVIRRMVMDLSFQLELVICPTLRETNGLAMSSRNQRLTETEKQIAPKIYQIISEAKNSLLEGESMTKVKNWVDEQFTSIPEFKLDYFEVSDLDTLQPIEKLTETGKNVICVAVYLGAVRLIDNIIF